MTVEEKHSAVAQERVSPLFTAIASLVVSFLWALLCNLVIEALMRADDLSSMSGLVDDSSSTMFLAGSLMVWLVLILFVALTGRLWLSQSLVLAASIGLGVANHLKIEQREEPLYPGDLEFGRNLPFLADMVGLPVLMGSALGLAGVVAVGFWLGQKLSGRYPSILVSGRRPRHQALSMSLRIVLAAACATVLVQAVSFNEDRNPVRAGFEVAGARWAWWYQLTNYMRNGVVAGFLYNMPVPAMEKPAGYSRERMLALADRYEEEAQRINARRSSEALDDLNVVLILSEAFSDPLRVIGFDFAEDPIPFTRSLMRTTVSGSMLAQMTGGGTANMEFEALTGMSLAMFRPQMNSPYQMLVPNYSAFPSIVGHLDAKGVRPVAIHPYMTRMYKREVAYPVLGFHDFIGESRMHSRQRIADGEFVSDASAFNEVRLQIERNEDPLLVNLVTMQNHYPTANAYPDPIRVTGSGLSEAMRKHAEGYARGLSHTDQALKTFLADLEQVDEKTAVIFYGDHQPGFWSDDVVERNGRVMRETPFFMWTNFTSLSPTDYPVLSPTQFLPLFFEAIEAPIPPYYALLDAVREHVPAMEQDLLFDPEGRSIELDDLSSEARQVLTDYRLAQYDLSIGHRWSEGTLFPQSTKAVSAVPSDSR